MTPTSLNDSFLTAFEELIAEVEDRAEALRPNRKLDRHAAARLLAADGQIDRADLRTIDDLKHLRDAIAHHRIDGQHTLVVTDASLAAARKLRDRLLGKVGDLKRHRKTVVTVTPDAPVGTACALMAERDFSVLPVAPNNGPVLGLLTGDDITHWVGTHLGEVGLLEDVPVSQVMAANPRVDHRYAALSTEARDVARMFSTSSGRLGAVLITYTGRPDDKLLGIVTPWDVHALV